VDIYSVGSYIVLYIMFRFAFARRVAILTKGIRGFSQFLQENNKLYLQLDYYRLLHTFSILLITNHHLPFYFLQHE